MSNISSNPEANAERLQLKIGQRLYCPSGEFTINMILETRDHQGNGKPGTDRSTYKIPQGDKLAIRGFGPGQLVRISVDFDRLYGYVNADQLEGLIEEPAPSRTNYFTTTGICIKCQQSIRQRLSSFTAPEPDS